MARHRAAFVGDYALCGVMQNGQPLTSHTEMTTDDYYDLVAMDAATQQRGTQSRRNGGQQRLDVSPAKHIGDRLHAERTFRLMGRGTSGAQFFLRTPADVSDWRNMVAISPARRIYCGVTSRACVSPG
jgi:hypothetical protein